MNIGFRVDASVEIGTGHVMRCLTLADWLRSLDVHIVFICRSIEGHMQELIESRGYKVYMLEYRPFSQQADALATIKQTVEQDLHLDWLIIDHYGIDEQWEKQLRTYVRNIFVIDDLANRVHECDLLLDQNYYGDMFTRYDGKVPLTCKLLLGPQYLLLRPEFYELNRRERDELKRVLVFFGGSDPTDETTKALRALERLQIKSLEIDVVVGTSNPKRKEIEEKCKHIGARFHCQINYLAKLMADSDVSLGAGGTTMWERCFMGIPSLVTIVAENQRLSTVEAANFGAVKLLGWHEEMTVDSYVEAFRDMIQNPEILSTLQRKGYELVGREQNDSKEHPAVHLIKESSYF